MKVLLLAPSLYTLDKTLKLGFERLEYQVYHHDYRRYLKSVHHNINTQIFRLPFKYRDKWESYFLPLINRKHLQIFDEQKPDIVFIYNNEMLLPKLLEYIQNRSKIVFFLGDNPFYTPTSNYNLTVLFYADLIVCPDSFWINQLKMLGIKNIIFGLPGFNEKLNYCVNATEEQLKQYGSELVYVGNNYVTSWGYKRTLFLSKFAKFDLKIYGSKNWIRWFEFFPELKEKFILNDKPLTFEEVNLLYNCSKISPIDANPGLLNGVHLRVFDCIASGTLPLIEYHNDIDMLFKDFKIPTIHSYDESSELAVYYLNHDEDRVQIIKLLQNYLYKNYKPEHFVQKVIEFLYK